MFEIVVSSALKKTAVASGIGISTVAIPATVITSNQDIKNKFLEAVSPLKDQISGLANSIKTRTTEGANAIWGKWSGSYNSTNEEIESYFNPINEKWTEGGTTIKNASSYLTSENVDSYNYYVFTLGTAIKSALGYIPVIIRDSVKEGWLESKDYELLTFRKLSHIINHDKFHELIDPLSQLGSKKHRLLGELTKDDATGILDIIRSLPFEEDDESTSINNFLDKVKKNIEEINKDETRTFNTAKELFIEVFTGKGSKESIKKNLEELKKKFDTNLDSLKEISGIEENNIEYTKKILEEIEKLLALQPSSPKASIESPDSSAPAQIQTQAEDSSDGEGESASLKMRGNSEPTGDEAVQEE